jgi:hypothetical protein
MNLLNSAPGFAISTAPERLFFLLFALVQCALILLLAITGSPFIVIIAMASLLLLYKIAFSVKATLFLLSFYIIIFPAYSWGKNYPFFKVYVSYPAVIALVLMAVLFYLAKIALKDETRVNFSTQDVAVLIFILLVVISAFRGFVNGHQSRHILKELFFLSLYGVYFLALRAVVNSNWLRQYWSLLVLATFIVSLQYLFLALSEVGVSEWFITRVTTRQPHLAQLVVPYLMSFFLLPSSFGKKLLAFFALVPILAMVVLCQQRSLWIAIPFSIGLLWIFSVWRRNKISLRILLKTLLIIALFVGIIILTLMLLDKFFEASPVATLAVRFESLTRLAEDESARMRMAEIGRAMEQWKHNIFLGTGLGSTIHRVAVHMTYDIVDNSYIFILWKAGLAGLLSYLTIIAVFFERGIVVFKRAKDLETQRVIASSLSGFAGLMLIALTNSSLMLYRFVLIWAILFGSLEFLYRNVKQQAEREQNMAIG